jgi:hypothetical protein
MARSQQLSGLIRESVPRFFYGPKDKPMAREDD